MDNSSTEDSSSDYSTESSDDDGMETAQINGIKIQLPQGLCERQDTFRELFTSEVWNSLSDTHKQHLQTFLPNFPENDELEKTKTLQRLFDCETFKFNSPLIKFHDDLKAGYFRPDIARMRKIIQKAERKEAKYRYKTFREQLKHEVVESQAKLLTQIRNLPPGVEPKQEKKRLNVDYVSHRTKRRYFQILSSIRATTEDPGCSSDENYPEGPPVSLSRKQKRHLNSVRNSLNNSKDKFFNSTMSEKLNAASIDLEKYITPNYNPFYINDESYRTLIYQHKKRKMENTDDFELNTKSISLSDIVYRTQLPYNKNMPIVSKSIESKPVSKKKIKRDHHGRSPEIRFSPKMKPFEEHSSNSDSDSDSVIDAVSINHIKPKLKVSRHKSQRSVAPKIKKEPVAPSEPVQIVSETTSNNLVSSTETSNLTTVSNITHYPPVKIEDLDGIDVMNIPIDLENSDIDILELSNKPELMQDTHANFFSLVRDVICSTTDHRMNMYMLQERLKSWQENPISPLNDWYSYTDNWIGILPSAITFLCGNASEQPDDFVPYMEYKVNLDVYQWIGAGRDSDNLLSTLCNFWLEHRTENKQMSPNKDSEIEVDIIDRSSTPPPPRFPTTWTVRKATSEEVKDFREQERRRYDNPHKAFTYRCNNYESVVGPLKGIYNAAVGNAKARGHTMLLADRPNFVTILSLVRDAAARLPNGEGTRAEICELLKASQYISSSAPDNLLQSVVSGALDRMHTQFDPCVKYDQKKKIWIYLHRNRTEEDFERIHQQYQGVNKSKKNTPKKSPSKSKVKQITEKSSKNVKTESPVQEQQEKETPTKPSRRLSDIQQKSKSVTQTSSSSNISSNIITVTSPQRGTSLLLSNNLPKQQQIVETVQQQPQVQFQHQQTAQQVLIETPELALSEKQSKEDKEITEALQAIMQQNRVASPTIKSGKNIVKILSPSQGKSLIIPTSNPQIIKQIPAEQCVTPTKQVNQVVTQQLLQTISAQQKQQILVQKQNAESTDNSQSEKMKIPVSVQQQIIPTINTQQLQNIKNVTLLRTRPNQNVNLTPLVTIASQPSTEQTNIVTMAVSKQDQLLGQPAGIQIKTSGNLTPAQQQQILNTIKQKILPNASVLTANQQHLVLKQKGMQGASLSGTKVQMQQQKITTPDNSGKQVSTSPGPVVAKVLTNAAGQVISVESLLAHQKQHGSLPQGTTLRVSGTKGGQQNIIHLTGTSKSNAITQFTVGSQSNILTLTSQPKLVMASQTATSTSVSANKSTSRGVNKTQSLGKLSSKTNQQLLNAKIVTQTLDGQKVMQPKLVIGQQNQVKFSTNKSLASKPMTLNVSGNGNTIRMVNAANLNLTNLGGKPVLLASKSGTIQNLQGQNVILQTQSTTSGASLVLQNAIKTQQAGSNVLNQSNIVFHPQVKVQQSQQMLLTTSSKSGQTNTQRQQSPIVVGAHPVRLQTNATANTQRVVLASQGQGGQIVAQQILLPAGFQGHAINIKALQGVKVIPIAQAHAQGKGVQGRQVFARVMNPNLVKQTTQTATATTALPDKATEVRLPSHTGE